MYKYTFLAYQDSHPDCPKCTPHFPQEGLGWHLFQHHHRLGQDTRHHRPNSSLEDPFRGEQHGSRSCAVYSGDDRSKDSQRSDQIAVYDPAVTGEGPDTSTGAGFAAAPCLWILLSSPPPCMEGHAIVAMSRWCAAQDLFHVYWYVDTYNVGVCRSVRINRRR